ncbi:MAG TPA: tetratricopeptide repeat protein [Rectinemataceae bacterium]|nr:tetratricopeptide repeat protein [Rectinemataceae bacterium]
MNRRSMTLFFLIVLASSVFSQTAKPASTPTAPSTPKITGTPTLAAARSAVAKMAGTDFFKNYVESYALALPLHEAVLLCAESLPKAPVSQRADLAAFGGGIALLAGRYEDAALMFSQGSAVPSGASAAGAGSRPDLNLKAARCYLASGNTAAAKSQLDLVPDSAGGKSLEQARHLALSWLYTLEGEPEKAFMLSRPLAAENNDPGTRREALFLVWLAAGSPEFADFKVSTQGFDLRSVEARLETEFPGSLERALTRKEALAKPASWLLTVPLAPCAASLGEDRSLAKPAAPKAQASESDDSPSQLQVGWFSRKENATALTTRLVALGFSAKTEGQKSKEGELRWAVIVDASGDWSKTQAKLKDLGYESYLLP